MNVRLRAMEPADLELLYQVENDSSSWDIGATTMPFSHDVLYNYIINTTVDIFIDKQVRLIIETTDGTAIGLVDLTSFDPNNRHAEVGIAILPQTLRPSVVFALTANQRRNCRQSVGVADFNDMEELPR